MEVLYSLVSIMEVPLLVPGSVVTKNRPNKVIRRLTNLLKRVEGKNERLPNYSCVVGFSNVLEQSF